MEQTGYNVEKRVNMRVLLCNTVIDVILFAAYLLEVIKKSRTVGYTIVFDVILLVPLILAFMMYRRQGEDRRIRYVIATGYLVMYAFVLLTSVTHITFVYVIPMLIALGLYRSYKFSLATGGIATLTCISYVIYNLSSKVCTKADVIDFEIMIALIIVVTAYTYWTSKTLLEINTHQLCIINKEKGKQEKILSNLVQIINSLSGKEEMINSESKQILDVATSTKNSMDDIARGAVDTAESIQTQLEMTSNIQLDIQKALNLTESINDVFLKSKENTSSGMKNVNLLDESSVTTAQVNKKVEKNMKKLNDKTKEMKKIMELIAAITKQTDLLALNASIEAARAGVAGRGFLVVAEEISNLANDTKISTTKIQEILMELDEEAILVASAVDEMSAVSAKQNELIDLAKHNFVEIQGSIESVSDNIQVQNDQMDKIEKSNLMINQSIEGISAFSEELMANSESTKELTERSLEATNNVNQLLVEVVEEINQLSNLIKE